MQTLVEALAMDARLLWVWLSLACGVPNKNGRRLVSYFGSVDKIYAATRKDYIDAGVRASDAAVLNALCAKNTDRAAKVIERCRALDISIMTIGDIGYPRIFATVEDAPFVLYYRGKWPDLNDRFSAAVVGTRSMTEYGCIAAYELSYNLTRAGAIIISGMALGIDGVASAAALDAGGTTVAVLGSGLDVIYPREHTRLFDDIRKTGAVISEYPPGTRPLGPNFPKRNRIISGLADATVVVEGTETSGALITANSARRQGRYVYAVPGKFTDPMSAGPNSLLRSGVHAVVGAIDIVSDYIEVYGDKLKAETARRNATFTYSEIKERLDERRVYSGSGDKRESAFGYGAFGGKGTEAKMAAFEAAAEKRRVAFPWIKSRPSKKDARVISGELVTLDEIKASRSRDAKTGDAAAQNDDLTTEKSQNIYKPFDPSVLTEEERRLYDAMPAGERITPDQLVTESLSAAEVTAGLTLLVLAGAVEEHPGGYYSKNI